MGFLSRVASTFTRSKKVRQAEDAIDPFTAARKGESLEDAASSVGRDVKKSAQSDLQAGVSNVLQDAAKQRGTRTALGLGGLGLAGAGAWGYTQQQKTEREKQQTERYKEYQDRVEKIQQKYENGEISEAERDRLLAKAEENYRYQENPQLTRSFTQWLGSLGTLQTFALLGVVAGVFKWIFAPIVRDMDFSGVMA